MSVIIALEADARRFDSRKHWLPKEMALATFRFARELQSFCLVRGQSAHLTIRTEFVIICVPLALF